jgi:hypothetical protein
MGKILKYIYTLECLAIIKKEKFTDTQKMIDDYKRYIEWKEDRHQSLTISCFCSYGIQEQVKPVAMDGNQNVYFFFGVGWG